MEPVELTDETMATPEGICWHFLVNWPSLVGHTSDPVAAANAAATIRLADAVERIADHLTAQAEAPNMYELEIEYQKGRLDGAREQREADKQNLANSTSFNAANALHRYPLVTEKGDNLR